MTVITIESLSGDRLNVEFERVSGIGCITIYYDRHKKGYSKLGEPIATYTYDSMDGLVDKLELDYRSNKIELSKEIIREIQGLIQTVKYESEN